MTIQANSGWVRTVSSWIAWAITASMIWYVMPVVSSGEPEAVGAN
jgi:hypothetical protein